MDQKNAYEQLNNIPITSERSGKAILRYGATAQLLLKDTDAAQSEILCDAAEAFLGVFGQPIQIFRKANGRNIPVQADNWRRYYLERHPDQDNYASFFVDLSAEGEIPPVRFNLFTPFDAAADRRPAPYGRCGFHFPLTWLKKNTDIFTTFFQQLCSILKPEQGSFGIGFASAPGMERKRLADAWPYLARFSGLDAVTLMDWSAPKFHAGIRAVNWLTVLDDTWVRRLGGQDEIAAHLHGEGKLHPYDGGVIVQACTHPQMGDVNMQGVPEAYAAIDALIAPHRYIDYPDKPMHLLKVPSPLDPHVATLEWLRRFEPEKS